VKGSKRGFLTEFLRRPTEIGAIAPSSKHLARRMLAGLPLETAEVVVEYGPGTGAFTGFIQRRLGPNTRFLAIEINPECVRLVRARHEGLRIHHGSVADVEKFLADEGINPHGPDGRGGVDLIISGLPWASFPEQLQRSILEPSRRVLKPGGTLTTFGYHIGRLTPAGQRFARLLPSYFSRVERTSSVLRNIPPAFVLRCTK
jgi:phosphatidylethanolamine/phosphatidyl-N-methylethanolamine N-methyltransferase